MPAQPLNEYQQQALDSLRRQQEAYLGAVRAWKKATGGQTPSMPMPEMPTPSVQTEGWPSANEIAEANQAFMNNVLEEQQRFFTSLNDILGGSK